MSFDGSRPLRLYTIEEIPARIDALMEKRRRIFQYDESVAAGEPDGGLLDAKQLWILAEHGCAIGDPFPVRVQISLGRAIDHLRSRLKFEGRQAAA